MIMRCPKCYIDLETPKGMNCLKYGFCQKCNGRAFDFGLLLSQVNGLYILKLIKIARGNSQKSHLKCPKCRKFMKMVAQHHACNECQVFWILNFEGDPKLKVRESKQEEEPQEIQDMLNALALSAVERAEDRWTSLKSMIPALNDSKNCKSENPSPIASYCLIVGILIVMNLPISTTPLELPELVSRTEKVTGRDGGEYFQRHTYVYSQNSVLQFQRGVSLGISASNGVPQVARMILAFFVHFSLFPVVLSILVISLFGAQVERLIGTYKFIVLALASSCAGFLGTILFAQIDHPKHYIVGSLSGIAGILGFYAHHWFLKSRSRKLDYRPILPLTISSVLVFQLSKVQAELGGYILSYESSPWFGFIVGALFSAFFQK